MVGTMQKANKQEFTTLFSRQKFLIGNSLKFPPPSIHAIQYILLLHTKLAISTEHLIFSEQVHQSYLFKF